MKKIVKVYPQPNYKLQLILDDGSRMTLNLKPKIGTIRFDLLRDEAFFRSVETDGKILRWGEKLELSSSEIFEMIKNQR